MVECVSHRVISVTKLQITLTLQQPNSSVNKIYESIVRLVLTIATWCIFLKVYHLRFNELLSFEPIILLLLGIYGTVEMLLIIRTIIGKNSQHNYQNPEESELLSYLYKRNQISLSQSNLDKKSSSKPHSPIM